MAMVAVVTHPGPPHRAGTAAGGCICQWECVAFFLRHSGCGPQAQQQAAQAQQVAAQKAAELQDAARAKAAELYTQVCCWVCCWVAWLQSTAFHHHHCLCATDYCLTGMIGCEPRSSESLHTLVRYYMRPVQACVTLTQPPALRAVSIIKSMGSATLRASTCF